MFTGLLDYDPNRRRERRGFSINPELTEQQKAILERNRRGMTPEPITFPVFMFGRWLNEDEYRAMQQHMMGSRFNRSGTTTGEYGSLRNRLGL